MRWVVGWTNGQPKKSAVLIFRRMLISHERSLAAEVYVNLPDRSQPGKNNETRPALVCSSGRVKGFL